VRFGITPICPSIPPLQDWPDSGPWNRDPTCDGETSHLLTNRTEPGKELGRVLFGDGDADLESTTPQDEAIRLLSSFPRNSDSSRSIPYITVGPNNSWTLADSPELEGEPLANRIIVAACDAFWH
jgi:hypothetical protein